MTPTTRAIRMRAAEIIEERGWWQGRFSGDVGMGPNGSCCVMAAIILAEPHLDNRIEVYGELEEELRTLFLVAWNDTPGRTVDEVLRALRGEDAE